MFKKLFLIYCLFTFLLLFSYMEKTDQKLIRLILENPQYIEYPISRILVDHKYTINEFPITQQIFSNKHVLRITFIIFITIVLLLTPILNLISLYFGYPYTFGLKYPLSIDGGIFFYSWVQYNDEITPQYIKMIESKLFWRDFFEANKVNTPQVYGEIRDGIFKGTVPKDTKLIWKLIYGDKGVN